MTEDERLTFILRLEELHSYFEEDLKPSDRAKVQEEIERIERNFGITLDE